MHNSACLAVSVPLQFRVDAAAIYVQHSDVPPAWVFSPGLALVST